jgi:serine/threonine protein kinase
MAPHYSHMVAQIINALMLPVSAGSVPVDNSNIVYVGKERLQSCSEIGSPSLEAIQTHQTYFGEPVVSYEPWCATNKYNPKRYDSIYTYLSGMILRQHTDDPYDYPGAFHAVWLITSGHEDIGTVSDYDLDKIQSALNKIYADQHIGSEFDDGEILDYRWQITSRLSDAKGFFNRGVHTVKDTWQALVNPCVVKVLPSEGMYSGYARREIDVMFLLKGHQNIVSIRDAALPENRHMAPWVVMDMCNAGTLEQCIQQNTHKPLPELFVWHVFESLVEAVRHCQFGPIGGHSLEWETVFHRDIIPGNILLHRETIGGALYPTVKLADFGCAITEFEIENCRLTVDDLPEEDPHAIPPEGPVASQAADIYQIGRVIETLILSKKPCIGRGLADARYSHHLRMNVQRCMMIKPRDRPTVEWLLRTIRSRKAHLFVAGDIKYEELVY